MAAVGRRQAAQQVVARHLVGVPQHVLRASQRLAEGLGGSVEAMPFDDVDERQVDIDVVVEAGGCARRSRASSRGTRDRLVVLDDGAVVVELGRPAEGHADGLRRPATADLVAEGGARQPDFTSSSRPAVPVTAPGASRSAAGRIRYGRRPSPAQSRIPTAHGSLYSHKDDLSRRFSPIVPKPNGKTAPRVRCDFSVAQTRRGPSRRCQTLDGAPRHVTGA